MTFKKFIKTNEITRAKAIKHFLLGNEYKLFLTSEDDENYSKIKFRQFVYRIIYFIVVIILFFSILLFDSSRPPSGWINFSPSFIMFLILAIKPIAHLINLKNKRKKKNIYLYRVYSGK